jgi:hypothetical protein
MKIQYNLIFENKKQQEKKTNFKILNVWACLMVLLQYMISPFFRTNMNSLRYGDTQ